MMLNFTKMQGLGNDFVMLDAVRQTVPLTPDLLRAIADRRFGIGCDQILVVRPAQTSGRDFRYQIFNSDGSEVENCGNGARCFVRFVREEGLTDQQRITVETLGGVIAPECLPDGSVRVDMGEPILDPARVPMLTSQPGPVHVLQVGNTAVRVAAVSMGNPHAVQRVDDVDQAPVTEQGPQIEHHPAFPRRVNVGYLQVLHRDAIRVRVWERGAGETLACGTGACAAVVSGILQGWLDASVTVETRGGRLQIDWQGPGHPVLMTGPAATSYRGAFDPDTLLRNLP